MLITVSLLFESWICDRLSKYLSIRTLMRLLLQNHKSNSFRK